MFRGFFNNDGPLMTFFNDFGGVFILTILWLICSLPLITVVPAATAFYYGMTKAVRHDTGYPAQEFFRAFKMNLLRGVPLSIALGLLVYLLCRNYTFFLNAGTKHGLLMLIPTCLLLLIVVMTMMLLPAILSRFSFNIGRILKMSLVMALKHIPTVILLMIGWAVVIVPIAASAKGAFGEELDISSAYLMFGLMVILPGIVCYLSVVPIEKILRELMHGTKAVKEEEAKKKEAEKKKKSAGIGGGVIQGMVMRENVENALGSSEQKVEAEDDTEVMWYDRPVR